MTRVFSITTIFISFFVFHLSFISKTFSNKDGKQDVPTKLCGDKKCGEILFSSKFIRDYSSGDDLMLKAKFDDVVNVVAIKFSNRPDFFEAKKDDKRGIIFNTFIDPKPYLQFLENALKTNLSLFVVEQNGGKFIREINAFPELIRDYSKYAIEVKDFQLDKELFEQLTTLGLGQDGGIKNEKQKEKVVTDSTENLNKVNAEKQSNENVEKKNIVEEPKKEDKIPVVPLEVSDNAKSIGGLNEQKNQEKANLNENQQLEEPEKVAKVEEIQMTDPKGEKENQKIDTNVVPPLNDLPVKTEETKKDTNTKQLENEQKIEKAQEKEQKLDGSKSLEENQKLKVEEEKDKNVQINIEKTNELVNLTNEQVTQPPIQLPATIQSPIVNEQSQSSEHLQQQPIVNSSSSTDPPPLPQPPISPESVPNVSPETLVIQTEQPKTVEVEPTNMPQPPIVQNQHLNQASSTTEEKFTESLNNLNSMKKDEPPIKDEIKNEEKHDEDVLVLKKVGLEQQKIVTDDSKPSTLHEEKNSPKQPEATEKKNDQTIKNDVYSEIYKEPTKINEQQKSWEFHPPIMNEKKNEINNIKIQNKDDNVAQIKNNIENVNQQPSIPPPPSPLPSYSSPPTPPVPNIPKPPIEVVEQPNSQNSPSLGDNQQQATTTSPDIQNNIGDFKEESHEEDSPKMDVGQQQLNDPVMQEQPTQTPEEYKRDKSDYCYKDDCKQLDDIPSDTPVYSKIRKMFRETMASIRGLLPEPLCYFEDTGLIIIAFVIISALLHLTNMLFSKSVGPDPFDHRLLHDCITRLKEQEVIIEQMNVNATENQHLREIAKNAEQLQRENNILAERIHSADEEISELKQENGELRKSLMSIYHELDDSKKSVDELKKSLDNKEAVLKTTESERQRIEAELDQTLSKLSQTQNREKYLDEDLKEALTKIDKLKNELEISLKESQKWQNEYTEKKAEVDELLEIIAEFNNKSSKNKNRSLNDSNSPDSPPEQMVESGELDADNGAGSGGSAGWSDLGDGIEITGSDPREKSPPKQKKSLIKEISEEIVGEENIKEKKKESEDKNTKLVDILEMAKLKGKLRSLETERGQLKFSLKIEKEEKENLQKELDRLRQEILERERDFEQRELDRHGLTQQCSKLLQMIEEKEKKVENSENEREKLRSRLSEIELNLRQVEDERRELIHKYKELEQSLKRSNELNGKLENKLFHEERKMNAKIRQLEEQLMTAKSSLSPLNLSAGGGVSSDLNMSGNSSDRDFVPLNGPEGGGGGGGQVERSTVPSLWSEIEASEPVDELVNLERKASMRRRRSAARESPFLGDIVHISSSGREERFNTSKYSSVSSAAAPRQRMRSRSAGRQSARLTGVSATNPLYNTTNSIGASTTSLNRQRASVLPTGQSSPYRNLIERPASVRPRNNLYTSTSAAATSGGAYSSDSNGASSPPPEMPLLSGVPPPGLNKRPAIILPQKMQVHLHKPANILPK